MRLRIAADGYVRDVLSGDAGNLEAAPNGQRGEASPVLDAAKALLLERGEELPILQQNSGDIAVIGIDAEYIHSVA